MSRKCKVVKRRFKGVYLLDDNFEKYLVSIFLNIKKLGLVTYIIL